MADAPQTEDQQKNLIKKTENLNSSDIDAEGNFLTSNDERMKELETAFALSSGVLNIKRRDDLQRGTVETMFEVSSLYIDQKASILNMEKTAGYAVRLSNPTARAFLKDNIATYLTQIISSSNELAAEAAQALERINKQEVLATSPAAASAEAVADTTVIQIPLLSEQAAAATAETGDKVAEGATTASTKKRPTAGTHAANAQLAADNAKGSAEQAEAHVQTAKEIAGQAKANLGATEEALRATEAARAATEALIKTHQDQMASMLAGITNPPAQQPTLAPVVTLTGGDAGKVNSQPGTAQPQATTQQASDYAEHHQKSLDLFYARHGHLYVVEPALGGFQNGVTFHHKDDKGNKDGIAIVNTPDATSIHYNSDPAKYAQAIDHGIILAAMKHNGDIRFSPHTRPSPETVKQYEDAIKRMLEAGNHLVNVEAKPMTEITFNGDLFTLDAAGKAIKIDASQVAGYKAALAAMPPAPQATAPQTPPAKRVPEGASMRPGRR